MKTRTSVLSFFVALFSPAAVFAEPAPTAASAAASTVEPAPNPSSPAPTDKTTATTPPASDTARQHHGLFLRVLFGGGYRSAAISGATPLVMSGSGAAVAFTVGGTVAENLILHGEIAAEFTSSLTLESRGSKVSSTNASMNIFGMGPGLTYYVMPLNLHFGGALLLSKLSMSNNDKKIAETNWGVGAALRIGKDWWIADHGTLGVVGQFGLASLKDKPASDGTQASLTATAATVGLTATFN